MARRTLVIVFLLIGLSSNIYSVSAHSVLLDSNPKKGETLTKELSNVILKFNTKIEKGSRFYIEDGDGNKRKPSKITLKDHSVEGVFRTSVSDGNYTLYWEVIGSDGHQIKGNYKFTIRVSGNENQNNNKQKDSIKAREDNKRGEDKVDQALKSVEGETEQGSSYWGIAILSIITLCLCIWIAFLARRKFKGR